MWKLIAIRVAFACYCFCVAVLFVRTIIIQNDVMRRQDAIIKRYDQRDAKGARINP